MIALLFSVQAEAERILEETVVEASTLIGSKLVIEGTLCNKRVLLCMSGMGKVNAAHAATLLISRFNPEVLLSFGIGGAYPSSGAIVGDVALAMEEIAGDEGVLTPEGFKDVEYIGIPLVKTSRLVIYSTYPASVPLVNQSLQLLESHQEPRGSRIHVGTFITLSACTGTAERAQELEARYHGLCENMEGAAVAQVATLHNIRWLEVRGISNIVEDRDLRKWDVPLASQAAQSAVRHIVAGWEG